MATTKQALAAARRRWGKRAFVRENKRALSPAIRTERHSDVKALNARVKELDKEIEDAKHDWSVLLKAAEFCRDVNAQEPSLSQLGIAASNARAHLDMVAERHLCREEGRRIASGLHVYRWDAGCIESVGPLGDVMSIRVQADTLIELLAKIEPAKQTA